MRFAVRNMKFQRQDRISSVFKFSHFSHTPFPFDRFSPLFYTEPRLRSMNPDTVFNNISIGNPNATEEEVMAAAKAAYCDEFVRNMPDGYQTVLGENGSTLSGGERQRISIARALLKNASIIFLDEATASLDVDNETEIQNAISKLVKGKTVLIIAHRMRTVEAADNIVVLSDGIVAENGTHEELMKENGLYHRLVDLQTASANWKLSV